MKRFNANSSHADPRASARRTAPEGAGGDAPQVAGGKRTRQPDDRRAGQHAASGEQAAKATCRPTTAPSQAEPLPSAQRRARRGGTDGAPRAAGEKRARPHEDQQAGQHAEADETAPRHHLVATKNKLLIAELRRLYPGRFHLRVAHEAPPAALYARAAGAARLPDLDVRVQDAHGRVASVPQWDELRVWDPGD